MTRRAWSLAAVGALLAVALVWAGPFGHVAPAGAAPYTTSATLAASTSAPCAGQAATFAGSGFPSGGSVVLTGEGHTVATTRAGSDGHFTARPTFGRNGGRPVTVVARSGSTSAATVITVREDCGSGTAGLGANRGNGTGGANAGSGSGTGSGTALTGVALGLYSALALAALVVGVVLLRAGRRRREA